MTRERQPRMIPNPLYCERCEGRGYLVGDAEWEPYAVKCPDCADADREEPKLEAVKERLAALQASSGYEASIMQLDIERLQALLRRHQVAAWCEEDSDLAVETRAALEGKS